MPISIIKSRRGVSEVLATVIIIVLVVAAASITAVILVNVDVVTLPGSTGTTTTSKNVTLTIYIESYNDTDFDNLYDTMVIYLSSDVDSPNIFVRDIDLLLPTGQTIDDLVPWVISDTSQGWNSEYGGYNVPLGIINATFVLNINSLSINQGEIDKGESFYIVVYYTYVTEVGPRFETVTDFRQSKLITLL
ncbi:MAG: hypothetical protein HGN29_13935 [Asgard group archaeon]|nr:hypothetical protein [Asgard group archaeon]